MCPEVLLWLIKAAGVKQNLVDAARAAYDMGTTLMQTSGAIRRHVPWAELYKTLWGSRRKRGSES